MRRSSGTAPGKSRYRTAEPLIGGHGVQARDAESNALQHHNTLVQKIFGPLKVFEKRDDSAVPGGAQSPDLRSPHGRGGTSSNEKDANKAQTKDDEQWSMTCEDGINELTTDDSEKRGTKKVKPVVLKEGENIEINSRKFKLCGAMMGNYGFVEIVEESKVPFYLHYESTINCKKKKLKVTCLIHVLAAAANRAHIFRLIQRGTDTILHIRYFVTDAYGPTLSDLQARRAYQKFTVGTATRLAIETLNAIEDLHTIGYVHRDIRPTSFVIGRGAFETHIYLINFGCVRRFRTKEAKIIPPRSYAPFISSIRYASRACHDRSDCARKDDLESWLYMSVEFYQINILSWRMMTNLAEIRKEKDAFMSERGARSLRMDCLSLPVRLPAVVTEILSLRFDSTPNYDVVRDVFKKHLETRSYKIRSKWDWASAASLSTESIDAGAHPPSVEPSKANA